MGRTVSVLRTVATALLLVLMLSVIFGCVNEETTGTDQTDGTSSADQPTDNVDEPTTDGTEEPEPPSEDKPDDTVDLPEVDLLIPDDEQFDQNGFPNPPEEDATKRY